jgi:hypothetical protein
MTIPSLYILLVCVLSVKVYDIILGRDPRYQKVERGGDHRIQKDCYGVRGTKRLRNTGIDTERK